MPDYPEQERVSNVYFGGNIVFMFKTNKGTILPCKEVYTMSVEEKKVKNIYLCAFLVIASLLS